MTCYISARHHTGRLLSHADNLQMAKNFHLPQSQRDWEKKKKKKKKLVIFHSNLILYITTYTFLHLHTFAATMKLGGYKSSLLSIIICYIPDNFHNSKQRTECFCPKDYEQNSRQQDSRKGLFRM